MKDRKKNKLTDSKLRSKALALVNAQMSRDKALAKNKYLEGNTVSLIKLCK